MGRNLGTVRSGERQEAAVTAASMTRTSWSAPVGIGLQEWSDHGRRLGAVGRAVGWWIGDWVRYGNERWGERYTRAARLTGYDVKTLMNMVYVASAYEPTERREALSWTHHAEVAGLERVQRAALLERAETERLSARCLREELRRLRRADAASSADVSVDRPRCPSCGSRLRGTEDEHADVTAA